MKVATLIIVIVILAVVILTHLRVAGKIGNGQASLNVDDSTDDTVNTGTADETGTPVQAGGTSQ